jgi:hypothetical protein
VAIFISVVVLALIVASVLFANRIKAIVEEGFTSLSQTLHERLLAVEVAVKGVFSNIQAVEAQAGSVLKSEAEYVDQIAEKVIAKIKAAEQTAQKLIPVILLSMFLWRFYSLV